jgi:hypothetical protein
MMPQSLVEERISALHQHGLQSSDEADSDMSGMKSRRMPPPIGSRIIIKKNASLSTSMDDSSMNASVTTSPPSSLIPTVDPRSRVDLLEKNLRYVQQQHEITLNDLHREMSRLQAENRGSQ